MNGIPGYDRWKLATPPEYEWEDEPEQERFCDLCGCGPLLPDEEDNCRACVRYADSVEALVDQDRDGP